MNGSVFAVRASVGCIVASLPHNESNFPYRGTDFYITKTRSINREALSIHCTVEHHAFVNIVTLAWGYVVLMAAIVEASGPRGSLFGAAVTVLLYGALPIAVLSYISGASRRRRAARTAAATAPDDAIGVDPSDGVDPDRGRQAAGERVAPEREES
jgi:hypothetical protein